MEKETRINSEQVSYITIKNTCKGRKVYYNGYTDYIWMEADYFKFLWLFKTKYVNYVAGYYKNQKREWLVNGHATELRGGEYDLLGEVYTKPCVSIFCAEKRIKTEYFDTIEQAKEWTSNNFPNCNVIIN